MENRQSKKNVLKLSVLAYIPIGILMLLMSVLGAVFQSKTWNIEIFCTIKICEIVALIRRNAIKKSGIKVHLQKNGNFL